MDALEDALDFIDDHVARAGPVAQEQPGVLRRDEIRLAARGHDRACSEEHERDRRETAAKDLLDDRIDDGLDCHKRRVVGFLPGVATLAAFALLEGLARRVEAGVLRIPVDDQVVFPGRVRRAHEGPPHDGADEDGGKRGGFHEGSWKNRFFRHSNIEEYQFSPRLSKELGSVAPTGLDKLWGGEYPFVIIRLSPYDDNPSLTYWKAQTAILSNCRAGWHEGSLVTGN